MRPGRVPAVTPDPITLFALSGVSLSDVATACDGNLVGDDVEIRHLRPASAADVPAASLGYASPDFLPLLFDRGFAAALVPPAAVSALRGMPAVVHPHPAEAFFTVHDALAAAGRYGTLPTHRGAGVTVAASARVHPGTWLGDDVTIADHAVVHPNTVIEDGTVVLEGTVVGGHGFQVATGPGSRRMVRHVGGVHVGPGVRIGASSTIDRALHSTMTRLGRETMVDHFGYVAHNVSIGDRGTVAARVALMGSVTVHEDVWLGPGVVVNQHLDIGRAALIGSGAVVVSDIPAHALAYGTPARVHDTVCLCRARIGDALGCDSCGRVYRRDSAGSLSQSAVDAAV